MPCNNSNPKLNAYRCLCVNELERLLQQQLCANPQVITITPGVISNDRKLQLYLQGCKQMNEINEVDYESTIISYQFTTLLKPPMNANFHNSTSCWIFDEVKNVSESMISHSPPSCRRSAIATIWSRMPCKCHEMPCNHRFERRYINPRVTYVEKPNRLLLNPLVSGQLTRFQLFIWEIRLEQVVLTQKTTKDYANAQMKESHIQAQIY